MPIDSKVNSHNSAHLTSKFPGIITLFSKQILQIIERVQFDYRGYPVINTVFGFAAYIFYNAMGTVDYYRMIIGKLYRVFHSDLIYFESLDSHQICNLNIV